MINRKQLKTEAGTAAFGRGEGYFESGHVGKLRLQKHGVQAKVSGSRMYQVRLNWADGFDHYCDCPMGDQGDCCKHCVAVGLAWLNRDRQADSTIESEEKHISNWLAGREKQELISMIMEASECDDALYKRLSLKASASSLDLNALKQSIRNTIETDYIDYYDMRSYVQELSDVTELLKFWLRQNVLMKRWNGPKKEPKPLPTIPIPACRNIWRSYTAAAKSLIKPLPWSGQYLSSSQRCKTGTH